MTITIDVNRETVIETIADSDGHLRVTIMPVFGDSVTLLFNSEQLDWLISELAPF